jgi:hypothetical protein
MLSISDFERNPRHGYHPATQGAWLLLNDLVIRDRNGPRRDNYRTRRLPVAAGSAV